jgi:hypothetical protein
MASTDCRIGLQGGLCTLIDTRSRSMPRRARDVMSPGMRLEETATRSASTLGRGGARLQWPAASRSRSHATRQMCVLRRCAIINSETEPRRPGPERGRSAHHVSWAPEPAHMRSGYRVRCVQRKIPTLCVSDSIMHRRKFAPIQSEFTISKDSIESTWGGVDHALAETTRDVVEGRGDWLSCLSSMSLA